MFGVLVEGANKNRSAARPRSFDKKCHACSLSKPSPAWIRAANNSVRPFATRRVIKLSKSNLPTSSPAADQLLDEQLEIAASTTRFETIPDEEAVQRALKICEDLARSLTESIKPSEAPPKPDKSATSNLLSLDEQLATSMKSAPLEAPLAAPKRARMADTISTTAYDIITDPKVFITPALLATYVHTQSILGLPQSFPQVFDLYACKPTPQPGMSPIKYTDTSASRVSSAVPLVLADMALAVAIEIKDLPLCLSIIDTTVCTTAYTRNKLFRRALLPATGLALAPPAAYILAAQLAQLQHSMDNQLATNVFFAGIVAYVGFTATIGYVAITTSNDQMDRISWAKGTALRDRWLREDERALVDRVAGAWGFQEVTMRGEEEGVEWEALREWVGRREMVLDNPELMEGME